MALAKVFIGVDPHKLSATIEVVDERETVLATGRFATDNAGYTAMRKHVAAWPERVWAVEGSNGAGRSLAQRLLADGEHVVDVPAKLSARARLLDTGHNRETDAHDAHAVHAGTGGYHPHESPLTMLVPIGLLAIGAVLAGQVFHLIFVGAERAPEFWGASIAFSSHLAEAAEAIPFIIKLMPLFAWIIGLWIAWNNYIRDPNAPSVLVANFPGVYKFVANKWYFDELYDRIFVRPALWLGRLFWHGGDEGTIDRFGPHGAAYAVGVGNRYTTRLQSGYLYSYAFVMLIGLIGAASWAIWWAK